MLAIDPQFISLEIISDNHIGTGKRPFAVVGKANIDGDFTLLRSFTNRESATEKILWRPTTIEITFIDDLSVRCPRCQEQRNGTG